MSIERGPGAVEASRGARPPVPRPSTDGRPSGAGQRRGKAAPGEAARTAPGIVDRAAVERYLERAARALRRHRVLLDRLDTALGDGDHGENMAVGFDAVLATIADAPPDTDLATLLRAVGHALVSSVGGASGPLYGSAFIEAGFTVGPRQVFDGPTLADALDAAARGLSRRGRCSEGDKTIFDALAPGARAFRRSLDAGQPAAASLREAARAAYAGMRATTPLVARRGLALRLGERSRGHQDPGATSCFLLLRAMVAPAGDAAALRGPAGERCA